TRARGLRLRRTGRDCAAWRWGRFCRFLRRRRHLARPHERRWLWVFTLGKERHANHANVTTPGSAAGIGIRDRTQKKCRHIVQSRAPAVDDRFGARVDHVASLGHAGWPSVDDIESVDRNHQFGASPTWVTDPDPIAGTAIAEYVAPAVTNSGRKGPPVVIHQV